MEEKQDLSTTESERCRCLLDLPTEIIELILLQDSLQAQDVVHVLQTCEQLRVICQSNEVWRQKLNLRWPRLRSRYNRDTKFNWYEEFKQRTRFGREVQNLVAGLSPKFYSHVEISKEGFNDFEDLLKGHESAGDFILDELMTIIHDGQCIENLTMKYYAEKVLRFMQQEILTKNIQAFMALPAEKQHLEIGAAMVAQWCQPTENITVNDVCDQIDQLAEEARREVIKVHPSHPFNKPQDMEQGCADKPVLSCEQCSQALQGLNKVLYNTHKFSGNSENYYQQTNSYIDKVLKTKRGIPITLCILYIAVARRLGVVCEPVNFPTHFLIRWKEHPSLPEDQAYTYTDAFNGGKFLSEGQLQREFNVPSSWGVPKTAEPVQVLLRMTRNLISIGRQQGRQGDNLLCLRNALELALTVDPTDFDLKLLLVRVNIHLNINLQQALDCLDSIVAFDQSRMALVAYWMNAAQSQLEENKAKEAENQAIKQKPRRPKGDIKYSVGTVMKHHRYNYTCVIYGWDRTCEASMEWIVQMGVHNLPNKEKQPFYNVLVEDGSNRYAAEENLQVHPSPVPISHPEVGKYFCRFTGRHYVPNAEKLQEYPNDVEHTNTLVADISPS